MPIKISNVLKDFGRMADAVKEMIEVSERLNSLEQAEAESVSRMAKNDAKGMELLKKAESVRNEAMDLKNDISDQCKELLEQARKEAAGILSDASTRGNAAIAAAEATALELNEAANKNYILSNVMEQQAKDKLAVLETEIAAAEKKLQDLKAAIAAIVGK